MLNTPVFCLTSDVDWASDDAISSFLDIASRHGITPTIFATHQTKVLDDANERGLIDLGIHPNFLPGSSHGADPISVIDHLTGLFPQARTFRSHSFVDSSGIAAEMVRRGFTHDSNLCLYLQRDLMPLRHWSGLVRFPVFWEDDVHWGGEAAGDWNLEHFLDVFLSPGLKVINVHPFLVAANIPSEESYRSLKADMPTASAARLAEIRYDGAGVGTFLDQLLEFLTKRGERFFTLSELHQRLRLPDAKADEEVFAGRSTAHTEDEHSTYWTMSEAQRQEFLRQDYEQRNAIDLYATSRDAHLRELEIDAIRKQLGPGPRALDLGCGNGYTLLSLARELPGWDMVGVDFSPNLISGALSLLEEERHLLQSIPQFVCADAIEYVRESDDASVDCIITERFLQNLPSKPRQRDVLQHIFRVLVPGGRLLMCEGEIEGFEHLNDLREATGLARIPLTSKDNVSALRFTDKDIEDITDEIGFHSAEKLGFSTYFLISRVLHPLLASPLPPRFDAPINDLARRIQEKVAYESGLGSNALWVLEKPLPMQHEESRIGESVQDQQLF